ncbi:MAG: tetratricopeptide repeat protein [Desulfobacterales bacterium]
MFLALPPWSAASTPPATSASRQRPISEITRITAESHEGGIQVQIHANGPYPVFQTRILVSPPRIILDIPSPTTAHTSRTIPLGRADLKSIRVGYHPKFIRLVFDLGTSEVPHFTTSTAGHILTLALGSDHQVEKTVAGGKSVILSSRDPISETTLPEPVGTESHETGGSEIPPPTGDPSSETKAKSLTDLVTLHDEIVMFVKSDPTGVDDPLAEKTVFLKSAEAYSDGRFDEAIEQLYLLIDTYPTGTYAERAFFLLAESFAQLHADSVSEYFDDIKGEYENAISRFPESVYVPEAFFVIGDLSSRMGNYYEALGYYNFVIEKTQGSNLALRASMRKANLLIIKNKKEDAVLILLDLVNNYPGSPMETDATFALAKIYFDMNRFSRSLDMLKKLTAQVPEAIDQYPEISLYNGYNHYQLGNYDQARKYLLRSYNINPEMEENHLVLTKIADAYLDGGFPGSAAKFYRLVLDRYPTSEGALISLTRLAGLQDTGAMKTKNQHAPIIDVQLVARTIDVPHRIYERVIQTLLEKDEKNPLIQLAMLKLAILHLKENKYDESYTLLKDILEKYPKTEVRKAILHAMESTLEPLLGHKMEDRRYVSVVNMYSRDQRLIVQLDSPEISLFFARAFDKLDLRDIAGQLFADANRLLPDKEKPADLLYYLSRDDVSNGRVEEALVNLDLLIRYHPSDKKIAFAYRSKGQILSKQGKYKLALKLFATALSHPMRKTDRIPILIDKCNALTASNATAAALETAEEAIGLVRSIPENLYARSQDIGDLYLRLGEGEQAIAVFTYALEREAEEDNRVRLQLAIAKGYEVLNQPKDYLALYREISKHTDPFWSHLAKERMAGRLFDDRMKGTASK